MQSKWGLLQTSFQQMTGGTFVEEDTPPQPSPAPRRRASAIQGIGNGLLDSKVGKSMLLTKDATAFALDIFETKLQNGHLKRQSKIKADITRQLDILERKMNDEVRLKHETHRLGGYNNILQKELKRNVAKSNIGDFKNDKEYLRLEQDIEELDQKHEKLILLRDQNEKCLDEIKDFYKIVTKVISTIIIPNINIFHYSSNIFFRYSDLLIKTGNT